MDYGDDQYAYEKGLFNQKWRNYFGIGLIIVFVVFCVTRGEVVFVPIREAASWFGII